MKFQGTRHQNEGNEGYIVYESNLINLLLFSHFSTEREDGTNGKLEKVKSDIALWRIKKKF